VLTSPEATADRPDTADTFIQAEEVAACLRLLGHETLACPWGHDFQSVLAFGPDLVFNLVEDVPEGPEQLHAVTRVLDQRAVPYTGAGTEALRVLGNKLAMKAHLRTAGLPVAPGLGEAGEGARYIVKSALEHASFGLGPENVVDGTGAALMLIAGRQAQFGGEWFAEAYVDGREFNVALLDGEVLPIAEIRFHRPPRRDPETRRLCREMGDGQRRLGQHAADFPAARAAALCRARAPVAGRLGALRSCRLRPCRFPG
jgi:D-alanine-D-alanine ligase